MRMAGQICKMREYEAFRCLRTIRPWQMTNETAQEERDWEEACRREDAIRALLNGRTSTLAAKEVEEVAVELGLSRATLYRMIRLYRAGGSVSALSRTQNEPDLYKRMENACSGRESIRFDAVKIKLLA